MRAGATHSGLFRIAARRLLAEDGQVVVVVALMLVALLGAASLSLDVGSLSAGKRRLQAVADAAAFAGATYLSSWSSSASGTCSPPLTADAAGLAACESVRSNLSGSGTLLSPQVTWTHPANGTQDAGELQVTVSAQSPSILAGIFGIGSSNVSATSAAENTEMGGTAAALFADDPSCSGIGIDLAGGSNEISGVATSNGTFTGSPNDIYRRIVQYGASCPMPSAGTYAGSPPQQALSFPESFPRTWDAASICNGSGVVQNVTTAVTLTDTSPDGIYCSTVSITDATTATQSVTLIAPNITISGNGQNLTPFTQDLLAYQDNTCSTPPCASPLSITDTNFSGDVYAPDAEVDIDANSFTSVFIEAYDITASNLTVTGDGPEVGASIVYTQ
jgi:Flp pilus assembly protein TadG